MTHRISFRSNPRLSILVLIAVLVGATAIVVFPVFGTIAGVVALLVAAYIVYQLIKFLRLQLASMVDVTDDGAFCTTSVGEKLEFPWKSVSHAGLCTASNGHRTVFLYNETEDKLVTVPDSFSGLDELVAELGEHVALSNYALRPNESVRDRLRSLLAQDDDEAEDE